MRRLKMMAILVVVLALSAPAMAGGIDILGGNASHNAIAAQIGPYLVEKPQWQTRPFADSPYYSIRIRWGGFEIEWLHDKIYLPDQPGIEDFSVSDGYNTLFINAVEHWGNVEGRIGVGPTIVHPEGVIDGHYIGELGSPSWRLGGMGIQGSLAYRQPLPYGFSFVVEGKITTGFIHLDYPEPVNQINIPLTGHHILLGVGFDF